MKLHLKSSPACAATAIALCLSMATAGFSGTVPWKFVVAGNSRGDGVSTSTAWVNTNALAAMAQAIASDRPDFVLFAGGMIYGSNAPSCTNLPAQYAAWSNALAPVFSSGIPVYPVRGSHETFGDSNGAVFVSLFGASLPANGPAEEAGLTYAFTHGNALVIGLDQYRSPHRVNQHWLDAQLSSNRLPHVFIFGHETAVQVSSPDCLSAAAPERDAFLASASECGAKVYFCALDCFYNRARLAAGGIMQVNLGTAGSPPSQWDGVYGGDYGERDAASNCFYSAFTNGYALVTVSNFNVTVEWKGLAEPGSWTVRDAYHYQRPNPAARGATDYDGDARSDPAVYSKTRGEIIAALSSSNYAWRVFSRGGTGAFAVPGDYDGDGKCDPAAYVRNSGLWQIALSGRDYAEEASFLGGTGYVPVPSDYDGDSKTDPAVYQKSSGIWQIFFSSNGVSMEGAWGGPEWAPAVEDYNGDARADIAVYRQGDGQWEVLLSGGHRAGVYSHSSIVWGGDGYEAFGTDFDADGLADPALFHRDSGLLLAALSGSGYAAAAAMFDARDSIALCSDYDGDGRSDPALYSQPLGEWLVAFSGGGYALGAALFGGPEWEAVRAGSSHDLVFLAFGDSITYGSATASNGPETAYPKLLENKLRENYAGFFMSINAGNPGETTEEGLERYLFWLDTNKPDLVLLMEGTNDAFFNIPYDQTEDNLRYMVQMALARGMQVVIATIPPVISNSYRDRSAQQARIAGFNPRIYRIAADYNIAVAPVFEAITAVPNWQNTLMDQPSANHPNDAGHAVIRDTFYAPVAAGLDSGDF